MKVVVVTSLLFLFSGSYSFGQYHVTMNLGSTLGPEFVGYKLDSSGLFAGTYVWDSSIFGGKCCKYKSIKIEYENLDELILYRIKLLINHHEFFKKDQYLYAEITGNPIVYRLKNVEDTASVNIYDYHFCGDNDDNKCYLISELRYLLSLLVPGKYDEFKFYPALYSEKLND